MSFFRRLMLNNNGATAVECTLIVSLIAVAAIASMRSVGSKVSVLMGSVSPTLN
ncbi:MAG: Flp family type IVb pilin [Proteobacteria bacterium]|nr:Flp family type IVb pilin [Pseudomonadota bacterium]